MNVARADHAEASRATAEPASGVHGYAKGIARKEAIVEVATRMFGRVGFHSATMIQIAADCGISRAGLLHHYPTKESLLEAVLEERDRADRERFRQNGSGSGDGLGVLRGMVDLAAHNSSIPGLIGLYAVLSAEATDAEHPAHDYFVRRYRRLRSGTRWALERARGAGYLVEGADVDSLAVELPALMDGLQVQWLLEPDAIDMAGLLKARLQAVLTVEL